MGSNFLLPVLEENAMKQLGELTKFLAKMAERREQTCEPTIYSQMMETAAEKKIDTLDPDFEKTLRKSVTNFVEMAFVDMIQDICAKYALMLLEVRNQKIAADTGAEVDIAKLEKMAEEQAGKFKVVVDVIKHALPDVDWSHIAKKIIAAGREAGARKEAKTPFSDN